MESNKKKMQQYIAGLDIGGTKIAIIVGDKKGNFYDRLEFSTKSQRLFLTVYKDIKHHLKKLLKKFPHTNSIGISIGGPLDSKKGIIKSPPNLPGWDNIPLKELLEKDFNIPSYIMHDAKTCVLAEWWFGAGRGCSNIIFLTFGTGIGCGIICDGKLLGNIPGEVGHWGIGLENGPLIYGRNNAWEGVASGAGIKPLANLKYPSIFHKKTTAKDVIELAQKKIPEALEIINMTSTYLGKGIAMLVDLFGSERVILGSLAVRAKDLFLPKIIEVFKQEVHPQFKNYTLITQGKLGVKIGDYGALCAAIYNLK